MTLFTHLLKLTFLQEKSLIDIITLVSISQQRVNFSDSYQFSCLRVKSKVFD